MKTAIEWADHVWNPVRGCSPVSPGCKNCYAARFAARMGSNPKTPQWHGYAQFGTTGPRWTGRVEMDWDQLSAAHKVPGPKPKIVFVNSMSDLFHEDIPDAHIAAVLDTIRSVPLHRFVVLTKRARRMRQVMSEYLQPDRGIPLRNLWLGVSAEDDTRVRERVPVLLSTPAAVRVLSAEPLLGPLSLAPYLVSRRVKEGYREVVSAFPSGAFPMPQHLSVRPSLDWVIVGGEAGPGARPMCADWARDIRRICQATGTAFFFKQWGEWLGAMQDGADNVLNASDQSVRVGKAKAGSLLDGAVYRQFPEELGR